MNFLQMSRSGAVMIMVIVVIRALAINKLPKKTFLVLWGVAAARLLIPFSFPSAFSVYSLLEQLAPLAEAVKDMPAAPFTPMSPTHNVIPVPGTSATNMAAATVDLWAVVWLVGGLVCAMFFAVAYLKCRREFKASLPVDNEYAKHWLHEHSIYRAIEIRQSGRISAPLAYGVLRPVILMPKTADWDDSDTLKYVLAHEYVHIRRFDAVTKLALTVALCVHWFNPAVWIMYVLANRDIELSCDEAVIRQFGERTKSAYAMTLIRMEETRSGLTPLCNNFSENAIEERITAIMKIKKTSLVALIAATALVIGVTTAFATSASSSQKQSDSSATNITQDTGVSFNTVWTDGVSFTELAPGEEITRSEKIIISPNEEFRYSVTYNRASLILEIGLKGLDGTEYSQTIIGGSDYGTIENVPDGTYELFVRNSGDYSKFPAYKDGSVSYSATGCINFLLEVSGTEINIDDLYKKEATEANRATLLQIADTKALLETYGSFGLSYEIDPTTGELSMSWQGKPVHSVFDAEKSVWIANSMRGLYLGSDTIDLEAVYERGKLTGLRETQAHGLVDSMILDDRYNVREVLPQDVVGVAAYASARATAEERGMSFAERFEKYTPFGITYEEAEGTTGNIYYNGQFVSRFVDLAPDGGVFTFSSVEQGGITVKTVYDNNGKLTGVEPVTA